MINNKNNEVAVRLTGIESRNNKALTTTIIRDTSSAILFKLITINLTSRLSPHEPVMETAMSDSITLEDSTITESQIDQNLIYSQRDLWYFRTHDGQEIGPFRYRSEAETGLHRIMGGSSNTH